jgi:GNAT superfamily N-acetyltransferase
LSLVIREARPGDCGTILSLIRALAEYEKLAEEVQGGEADLRRTLFAPEPRVFCLLAEIDGEPAGFALWFYSYSTFFCRHGIWLEDLFVMPHMRGHGIGKALVRALASRCVSESLPRLEWSVLDWNEPAIGFYRSLGAAARDEWTTFRLAGPALTALVAIG